MEGCLQWNNLSFHISKLPKFLMFMIKKDLQMIQMFFPVVKVIFSEIIPRLVWLSPGKLRSLEKIRKRVNHSIEKFMQNMDSFSFRHVELEGGFPGLYRRDGVHLSNIGLDIFNTGLQSMIEKAAVLG